MSVFILKILATIAMVFDHSGYIIFHGFSWMNYIGRFAFPIFAFLITEGYVHTHHFKKYCVRIFLCAIISQIPYFLYTKAIGMEPNFNILFTLLLGLLTLRIYEVTNPKWFAFLLVILNCILAQLAHFDYGWFGIASIFTFYIWKEKKVWMCIVFALLTIANYMYPFLTTGFYEYTIVLIFCVSALFPILLYNTQKGKSIKYFFYIFYPLHLFLLYGLSFCI